MKHGESGTNGRPSTATLSPSPESEGRKTTERCLTGRLKELGLPEILHFLSLNKKTGKLSLTRRDAHGLVVLRNGRIIYATSSSVRETFGNILVCRGLISEAMLTEALERQQWSDEGKRLGSVLVEMGQLRQEDVEEVVRYQVGLVLTELCRWADGFFRFDAVQVPEGEEIEVDAEDFVVGDGLSTERVLLEVAARFDESTQEGGEGGQGDGPATPPGFGSHPTAGAGEVTSPDPRPLPGTLVDLPTPALRGEITLMLMRFATRTLNRGVLFIVRSDEADSMGFFGIRPDQAQGRDRAAVLRVPLAEPSVVSEVIQRKQTYRGPLAACPGNDRLVQQLGGRRPAEVVVIPLIVAGSVAMVLYGDNVPDDGPIGSIRPLESVMTEAGLEMEKEMLEGRIKSFERSRRRLEV